jgi:hypothetical protein
MIGWRLPEVSLTFPALALINSLFFHIGPPLVQRRFSPGTITAALLFLPSGSGRTMEFTWIGYLP